MATLRDAVRLFLEADATLTGLLIGGIHDADELDRNGLDPETVRDALGRLKPCMVIRWRNSVPYSSEVLAAETQFAELYFYQDRGRSVIVPAKARVKTLLHRKIWFTDDVSAAQSLFAGTIGEFVATELDNASAEGSRYQIIMRGK